MSTQPTLSIVIPTKNRYSTLEVVIKAILKWENRDFELVIQDNSDTPEDISPLIDKYKDDVRLRYFYESKNMAAPENCDLAINNSTGKYVCFIGDDDGADEKLVTFTQWLDKNDIDSGYCSLSTYHWPGMTLKYYGTLFTNKLTIPKYTGKIIEKNTEKELKELLKEGAQIFPFIPRVYKGIVSRRALNKLFAATQTYFPGPVPDMANAVGLVPYCNRHVHLDYPIMITGASTHSMAGKGAQKKHHGEIAKNRTLPENTLKRWSKMLPTYWSGPTIWAEGAIKAMEVTGQKALIKHFNFEKVFAACLMYIPDYRKRTNEKISELSKNGLINKSKIYWYITKIVFNRINTLVSFKLLGIGLNVVGSNFLPAKNIDEAMVQLKKHLAGNNINFDEVSK